MKNELPVKENIIEFMPVIRMLLSDKNLKITRLHYNSLIREFCADHKTLESALKLVELNNSSGWDGKYVFLENTSSSEMILISFNKELASFQLKYNSSPKIIALKDYGIIAVADNSKSLTELINVFEETLESNKNLSKSGMADAQFKSKEKGKNKNPGSDSGKIAGILNQKICIVTGGAQGFGEGISKSLVSENANLVIADLNDEKGFSTTMELKSLCSNNELIFVKTDVSNPDSVKKLVFETVKNFGGIDVFVSNAGILKAGGLDEMDPATFELMTKVNYEGYFLCTKYASAIMKLQSKHKEGYYSDIIQINSKSGLKGSNRNFAYAGGKFGGIGLTQSFALELAPSRVKVNAICPGNFFEGPLWADPEKGLFVQYLKAGKVSGAKTIEDVKRYYEKQVPLGRGCRVQDVMKALLYIVTQEYETGQAVPVTGGQEMMS